jgi:hypothetical protein
MKFGIRYLLAAIKEGFYFRVPNPLNEKQSVQEIVRNAHRTPYRLQTDEERKKVQMFIEGLAINYLNILQITPSNLQESDAQRERLERIKGLYISA